MIRDKIAIHIGNMMLFTAGGMMGLYVYLLGVTHP